MLKFFRFGMWAIITLGFSVALIGLILMYRTMQFKSSATMVSGTVVELVEKVSHSEEGTSVVYAPRVIFRTAEGQETGFVSDTGSNPPGFYPGETVEVMYQPGHPEDAKINTFWQLWLGPVICLGTGGVFLLFGVGFFVLVSFLARQEAKQQHPPVPANFSHAAYGRR